MDTAVMEAPGVAPLNLSEAGSWLCSQDGMLRELVKQIGAWTEMGPDMRAVRDALILWDEIRVQPYAALGRLDGAVRELSVMAPSEVGRLRLLATLAPGTYQGRGLQFCIDDVLTFDQSGKALVVLWLDAVRAGVVG